MLDLQFLSLVETKIQVNINAADECDGVTSHLIITSQFKCKNMANLIPKTILIQCSNRVIEVLQTHHIQADNPFCLLNVSRFLCC